MMGSFANTLIRIMLGWLREVVYALWTTITSPDGMTFFSWIGEHWLILAAFLCGIGLALDLGVYLVRWALLHRAASREDGGNETTAEGPAERNEVSFYDKPEEAPDEKDEIPGSDAPDFSRWESAPEQEPAVREREPEGIVTKSGYHVPADSPYRRPPARQTEEAEAVPEPVPETEREEEESRVNLHRRRRLRVSELFSDPEEELKSIESPQQLIDSRKAYHEPVYPRGWRKEEEKQE
jgi:hypothetical protein